MTKLCKLIFIAMLCALGVPAFAQSSFILSVSSTNAQAVIDRHGFTVVKELFDGSTCVYLVTSPSDPAQVETEAQSDIQISGLEPDQVAALPELKGLTQASLAQSNTSILDTLPGRTLVNFFGSIVPSNYTTQPATTIIRLAEARNATQLTGAGIVAIIDTGADPNHPALVGALGPGFDFTREAADFSEFNDLDPALAAQLQQSNTSILDAQNVFVLNGSTALILDQSNTSILDQSNTSILDSAYPEFGHGTMVAGVVHLVAPTATIMPLKAFRADGTSNLSDIVRAIYYAADHGANVISMSFSTPQSSASLQTAIEYALNQGATLVAAAGNDGLRTRAFPASYNGVEGIGSTSDTDVRSTFSNFGPKVTMFAAPGEGVITTFPGGLYAAAWGTSFSTPMVAGSAALVIQAVPKAQAGDVTNALSKAKRIPAMGYGRIDLVQALGDLAQ